MSRRREIASQKHEVTAAITVRFCRAAEMNQDEPNARVANSSLRAKRSNAVPIAVSGARDRPRRSPRVSRARDRTAGLPRWAKGSPPHVPTARHGFGELLRE